MGLLSQAWCGELEGPKGRKNQDQRDLCTPKNGSKKSDEKCQLEIGCSYFVNDSLPAWEESSCSSWGV